jgi:hypothetical protein
MPWPDTLIYRKAKLPEEIPYIRAIEVRTYDDVFTGRDYLNLVRHPFQGIRVVSTGLEVKGFMVWRFSQKGVLINRIAGEGIDKLLKGAVSMAKNYGTNLVFTADPDEHEFLADTKFIDDIITMEEGGKEAFFIKYLTS